MPRSTGSSTTSRATSTTRSAAAATVRNLVITAPARSDLSGIRRYTLREHGRPAADSYTALLKQALRDIREDPYRPGSRERAEIGENIRSYHTALSRDRSASGVKSPRHFILYFLPGDDEVVVSRVLHDSRDLARHVAVDHLEQARTTAPRRRDEGKTRG
jgi:toxin ParE1/3/4